MLKARDPSRTCLLRPPPLQTKLHPTRPRIGKSYGNITNKQRARLTNDDELMKSLTIAADKTRCVRR